MVRASVLGILTSSAVLAFSLVVACSQSRDGFEFNDTDAGGEGGSGSFSPEGGFGDTDGGGDGDGLPEGETKDPVSCAEAKTTKSYVGCDYWPTVTPNPVWSIFDYAIAVANTGKVDATVTITGPNATNRQATIPAGAVKKIALPWVPALKGIDSDECGNSPDLKESVIASEGAYHVVSSTPVIVYQFNALQYRGQGGEAPDGSPKDWSTCPGLKTCVAQNRVVGCFSFTNDASLLLPSTAMTTNYRVMGYRGRTAQNPAPPFNKIAITPAVASITTTEADNDVTIDLAPTAKVVASVNGQAVPATNGGGKLTVKLAKAGDVLQVVTEMGSEYDMSGSLVHATKPVQVIASNPCIVIPDNKPACDHIEETVLPAETLGKRYVVIPPTGPKGTPVSRVVRFYGNKDGTTLTYTTVKPPACPATLNAGQVVDCGVVPGDQAFEVSGTSEFGVATFLLGAAEYGAIIPGGPIVDNRGDPDQSQFPSVEQFRTKYVFLAPTDYPVLWADVTATKDAAVEIDGKPVSAPWQQIGSGPFGVHRINLTQSGQDGQHTLTSKRPVGVQVIGFGDFTSFQYPAGLNLKLISAPPVPK